jgi:predicted phosphodiesterase
VRGNNDRGPWAAALLEREVVEVGGCRLYVLHDVKTLGLDPVTAGLHAVIAGHSHRPLLQTRDGVLFVNPGSAGPRRFTLPIAVARLEVGQGQLGARIIELPIRRP